MTIIPFDQREGSIWMNGEIIPWKDAKVHVLTHGLHYASSVFEGERAYNGKIFKTTEHSQRLHKSAELMDFKIPYSVEQLNAAKDEVVKLNGGGDQYVRPVAFAVPK
jgi:branched-chain amino acid aminotransferase